MQTHLRQLVPQPLTGVLTMAAGVTALSLAWTHGTPSLTGTEGATTALLTAFLVVTVVLSYQFPIHIRISTKIYVGSVPLYLIAALLPPPIAGAAVGLGVLAGNLTVRSQRGSYLSDIATDTGRLMAVALLGSLVAHVPMTNDTRAVALVGAAVVMWLGDAVTIPLLLAPVSREAPLRVAIEFVRGAGAAEGAQYLVGLLGALVARQEVWALALLFLPTALVYFAFRSAKEMHEGTRRILESMADAVDLRDPSTGGHSRRVTKLTASIMEELGRSGPEAELIIAAARVHDIGKIGVPDYILKKEGLLTQAERGLMEAHVDHGAELLSRYPDFARGADIVRHHHEKWSGEGYPHGLKAAEIPFGARVVAVADSFDAMTMDRPYRRALPVAEALLVLRNGRGREWDPIVVDALLRAVERQRPAEAAAVPLRLVSGDDQAAADVTA